ncbi:hypothetical protein F441_10911 [Phytophthora nicotianae CJ01A1]|uniref:Uncharacterized protein n=2 Tax=Phytophthora nicotianae TaxID=4792 RepID=W2Q5Y7_PHYN3|nr:hypothetical protein PPTG_23148 [Phytophthora nicotianae INRA-310]ETN07670.1 hypothetical protein PPTG_23148 [Phytophthora nicotianae INRA-310]ETP14117.1 hypothetical protein F441_10911 [Phytophthora nicotianae CJ01A1]
MVKVQVAPKYEVKNFVAGRLAQLGVPHASIR